MNVRAAFDPILIQSQILDSRTMNSSIGMEHHLIFRVLNLKTNDSWKQLSTSTFKADQNGAFEDVLFKDGIRLRPNGFCCG